MIAKSKPLSEMFSVENTDMYLTHEFQPYVKLENVFDNIDLLIEENVSVSWWPVLTKIEHLESNISQLDTIKTEIKEEEFSENINDVEPTLNEESLSCNTDLRLTLEDLVTIKSEKEDNSIALYSLQQHPATNPDWDSTDERNNSTSQVIDCLSEKEVTRTSLEEHSEDLSSFDLHLSPDSDNDQDEIQYETNNLTNSSTQTSIESSYKDLNLSLDTSSLFNADKSNSSRTSVSHKYSPDIFEESPEVSSAERPDFIKTRSSTRGHPSSDDISPAGDNRERQEVWDSQELSEVSQRLMLRSKQAKRLIMEVIRKRQMEEETLDAFKKRLRRM